MKDNEPKFLYRYRHLQGKHREWTMKIMTNFELYFASPKDLNDPFDCKVRFRQSFSKNDLRKRLKPLIKKYSPELNREQRRTRVSQDVKEVTPKVFLSSISAGLQKSVDNLGILSLSSNPLNILLWSHYAYGHTGICLKFLATENTPFFGLAQKVNYEAEYPVVDLLKDSPDKQVDAFLLTKAIDWEYENEWRIIDHIRGPGCRRFPEELLVGIIFGARMPIEDKKAVVKSIGDRIKNIAIEEAFISDDSFSISIKTYEPEKY